MQRSIFNVALVALVMATGSAIAEEEASPISFNVGLVSDYMWRGVTQSENHMAVQGGVDFEHKSGFSIGTWASSVDFSKDNTSEDPSVEWDFYAGFGNSAGDFGYNITLSYYTYKDNREQNANFTELGVSTSWKMLEFGVAYTLTSEAPRIDASNGEIVNVFREGDLYYYGKISYELPKAINLSATLGYYDFRDAGSLVRTASNGINPDYMHWQISISRDFDRYGEISLNYDQNDGGRDEWVATDDDPKFSIGWLKKF